MQTIARWMGVGLVCALTVGRAAAETTEAERAKRVERQLQVSCEAGDARACYDLGGFALYGIGVPEDPLRGARLFARACDLGAVGGCGRLGNLYVEGLAVPKKPEKGVAMLQRACDGADAWSCETLASLHEKGKVVEKDAQKALALKTRACELEQKRCKALGLAGRDEGAPGDTPEDVASRLDKECEAGNGEAGNPIICANLGIRLLRGTAEVKPDPARAYPLLARACKAKFAVACGYMGELYRTGNGVEKDLGRALEAFEVACSGGNGYSCTQMGKAHYFGSAGKARDFSAAADFLEKACAAKSAEGCALLGMCVMNGEGREKDPPRAVSLVDEACTGGEPLGCSFLATFLERGLGAPADLPRATALHRKACEGNVAKACFDLGVLHATGRGVPRDLAEARGWFEKACEMGNEVVCKDARKALERIDAAK